METDHGWNRITWSSPLVCLRFVVTPAVGIARVHVQVCESFTYLLFSCSTMQRGSRRLKHVAWRWWDNHQTQQARPSFRGTPCVVRYLTQWRRPQPFNKQ